MINNDREYDVTKELADKFERSLAHMAANPDPNVPAAIQRAQRDATQSVLEELRQDLAEYDARRSARGA